MIRKDTTRCRPKTGMSLLEVTIASFLTVLALSLASSFSVNMSKVLVDSIADTKLTGEARLAIESIRRDLSGSDPGLPEGLVGDGDLVGQINMGGNELRICFDGGALDGSASWSAPDRTITYQAIGNRLVRTDMLDGTEFTIARYVEDFLVTTLADGLQIDLTMTMRNHTRTFQWIIPDIN